MNDNEQKYNEIKEPEDRYTIEDFISIVRRLMSKDGCPWDSTQTHESIKECLINECNEVIEAIDKKDEENLEEELGDVLMQIVMHSIMSEKESNFTFEDVVDGISRKMIFRHPGIFENSENVYGRRNRDNLLKDELIKEDVLEEKLEEKKLSWSELKKQGKVLKHAMRENR